MQATAAFPQKPHAGEEHRSALVVILTVVVALLLGLALRTAVEGRSTSYSNSGAGVSLNYPAAWIRANSGESTLLSASDPRSPTAFASTFSLRTRAVPQGQTLNDVATGWRLSRSNALAEFSDLGARDTTFGGRRAIRLHYAYVAPAPGGAGMALLPVVVEAYDTIVVAGDRALIFTTASDADHSDEYAARFNTILSSVKMSGK